MYISFFVWQGVSKTYLMQESCTRLLIVIIVNLTGEIYARTDQIIGGTYDQRTWSNYLEAVQLVDCDTHLKITIPIAKRKHEPLSCQITAFIWCLCVCICRTMLEHFFLVGWVTRIAVKPRKISIYRTFTVSGIFYQMMQKKPCKAY